MLTPAHIKGFRLSLDMTQGEFARLCLCDRRTVLRWERGGRTIPPTVEILVLLANNDAAFLAKWRAVSERLLSDNAEGAQEKKPA